MPGATDAPFDRVGIAGVGLIGASIAAAIRRAWPDVRVTGVDRPDVLAEAGAQGLVDARARSIEELAVLDLVVVATPVPAIVELLAALGRVGAATVVTDTGSTKRDVMRAAARAGLPAFVGGHPMAGAERPGLAHARRDLFDGQPWILVESPGTDAAVTARVEDFVRGLGASPRRLDAETHDRAMAYVSHLPQLLAVALMNAAGGALGAEGLALAGRAFGEMTRLASSPADLWDGILATNADHVADAVAALVAELPARADRAAASRWTAEAFPRAAAWREGLAGRNAHAATGNRR